MKYLLLLSLLLSGCEEVNCCNESSNELANIEVGEMHDYKFDDSEIDNYLGDPLDSINKIFNWIYFNLEYKAESSGKEYWKLPEETYLEKEGDCEDLCILFMYLLKEKLNIDSELVAIKKENNLYHALIFIPSTKIYLDPQGLFYTEDTIQKFKILWSAPYPEVIWMTYYYHKNVGIYY